MTTMTASDRRRFEQTALPLQENLYGAAMRLTRDPAEAEDLVQDTFVRAYRFWDTFKQGTNIKAWMFTILRNTFINGYHRRGRAAVFTAEVTAEVRSTGHAAAVAHSTSAPAGPEQLLARETTERRIAEALAQLPADYRRAVELADLVGLSYKEIADLTGAPIGTVMSRIFRGRRLLHALLYDHARELNLVNEDVRPGQRRTKYARNPEPDARPQLEMALW